jgi:6-methylsalicylate decarboxylase
MMPVQRVLNGIVDRYPGARIILAHAGGFMPYASHRFAALARVFRPDAAKPADILASPRRAPGRGGLRVQDFPQ